VKVVLSGEGADELFWGYDTYRYERMWRWFSWARQPLSQLPVLQRLVSAWEVSSQVPAGLTRLGKLFSANYDLGAARWTSVFADHSIPSLIPVNGHPEIAVYLREIEEHIVQLERSAAGFEASLAGDLSYWLPDDLLMKVDRMTMAHSVEARAPFLDPPLINKALSLPHASKLRGNHGKLVLRNLVENHFPAETGRSLAWRKKHGFEVPLDAWLRTTLREAVEDRLSPAKLARSGLLDTDLALQVKKNFYSLPRNTALRRKLWLLLCFQTWYEGHENGFGYR
jgi:asparagine synthase (glutamine-hydrolysing)